MTKRKEILPTWIRFSAWIFLIFAITPLVFLLGLTGKMNVSMTVFGLEYSGYTSLHPVAIWITIILSMAATVSYGILWGKDWAVDSAIVYTILALATNCFAVVFRLTGNEIYIPLEPLFLIPFLVSLIRRRDRWKRYPEIEAKKSDGEQDKMRRQGGP